MMMSIDDIMILLFGIPVMTMKYTIPKWKWLLVANVCVSNVSHPNPTIPVVVLVLLMMIIYY